MLDRMGGQRRDLSVFAVLYVMRGQGGKRARVDQADREERWLERWAGSRGARRHKTVLSGREG